MERNTRHNLISEETSRAITRFVAYFTVCYTISAFILALLGVFRSEEVAAMEKDSLTNESSEQVALEHTEGDVGEESEQAADRESHENVTLPTEGSTEEDPRIPHRIEIPAIDLKGPIGTPHSRDVAVLNDALLNGVTYYPSSGHLGEDSNILLFGHSSGLPVVINQNFKIFNRIKELREGDYIYLESAGYRYTYKVIQHYEAKDSEIIVTFNSAVPKLTLTTCNVFGAKEDRFVVEAVFVKSELAVRD